MLLERTAMTNLESSVKILSHIKFQKKKKNEFNILVTYTIQVI